MTTTVMIFVPKANHQRVKVSTELLVKSMDGQEERWMPDDQPRTLDHGEHIFTYVYGEQRLVLEELPFPPRRQRYDDTILGLEP